MATISPLDPRELPNIREFLLQAFHAPAEAPCWGTDLLEWKYFTPHPLWPESRSYVLRERGDIAAHGAIAPVCYQMGGTQFAALQVVDWAANRSVPGGGLVLLRHCLNLCDVLLMVGGSEANRRLIDRVPWCQAVDPMPLYARPLRPAVQVAQSRSQPVRDAGRFTRGLLWSVWPPLLDSADSWTCTPASQPFCFHTPEGGGAVIVRSDALIKYLLQCPASEMIALDLGSSIERQGHALLSRVEHQVRIADLTVHSECPEDWRRAVAAVLRYVRCIPEAYEIAAGSTGQLFGAALLANGFRQVDAVPVWIADPNHKISPGTRIEINLSLGDGFYRRDPGRPFWT